MKAQGFSLIELLVVIAITAVLLSVAVPNYLDSRGRGKDVKIKGEMVQLKNALRMYYNDYQKYPMGVQTGNNMLGCGKLGVEACPCMDGEFSKGFAAGDETVPCKTIYMKKLPVDLGTAAIKYQAKTDRQEFCLKYPLSNASDPDLKVSKDRCNDICLAVFGAGGVATNEYVVCQD